MSNSRASHKLFQLLSIAFSFCHSNATFKMRVPELTVHILDCWNQFILKRTDYRYLACWSRNVENGSYPSELPHQITCCHYVIFKDQNREFRTSFVVHTNISCRGHLSYLSHLTSRVIFNATAFLGVTWKFILDSRAPGRRYTFWKPLTVLVDANTWNVYMPMLHTFALQLMFAIEWVQLVKSGQIFG